MDQTCDNLKQPGQDCKKEFPAPHISGGGGCQQWKGTACNNATPCHHSSAFYLNSWSHTVLQHLAITHTVYCCCVPLVKVFQTCSCESQKVSISIFLLLIGFCTFHWRCKMFPFHTLVLTSWLVVVDPCLVPSDNVSQECLTFMTTANWNASADCQAVAYVIFCELYNNPLYAHFTMSNPLWLISWAKSWPTRRWWATLSIVAHRLTRITTWTCSIFSSVPYMEGHPATGETCATAFKHGKPFTYTTP